MKWNKWLFVILFAFLSGCGAVDWFPANSSSSGTTTTAPSLTMAFSPAAVLSGATDSTLTFTITNVTGNPAQTGLGFTETLPAGLTISGFATNSTTCPGTISNPGPNQLVYTGGSLAAGTANCTITATVTTAAFTNTTSATFTNKTANITATSVLQNMVTDQTLKAFPSTVPDATSVVTATNLAVASASINPNDVNSIDYTLQADATNSSVTVDANINIAAIAVDVTGADIASTATTLTGVVTAGTTTPATAASGLVTITIVNAAKIQFWRIVKVTIL